MATLVAQLASITEFTVQLIEQIESVKQTVSAEWTGEANARFQTLHAEWMHGAQKMTAVAHKITARATTIADNYEQVADHVTGLWI
ncbi:MAG: WXG100 family type VII secretion target [Actinomycetota bacterium]|nr:WXG100 family type VII secretion target [Actinomycetota bacterium]